MLTSFLILPPIYKEVTWHRVSKISNLSTNLTWNKCLIQCSHIDITVEKKKKNFVSTIIITVYSSEHRRIIVPSSNSPLGSVNEIFQSYSVSNSVKLRMKFKCSPPCGRNSKVSTDQPTSNTTALKSGENELGSLLDALYMLWGPRPFLNKQWY